MQTQSANATYCRDIDLAERYGVARNSIWRWARLGQLPPPVQLTPGCSRWNLADVEAWEAKRAQA